MIALGLRVDMPEVMHKLSEIDAELARRRLSFFVQQAWHVLEPATPLIWSWHMDAICEHLEAATDGRITRLLIAIPPGHCKSLLVSVFWPAWVWLKRPSWRGLFSSYSGDLSVRDSVRCRTVIQSDWYQDTFAPEWKMTSDQNVKSRFENTARGVRQSLSVGGLGSGFRGDCVVVDDPSNVEEFPSDIALADVVSWWDKRMSSRFDDMRTGVRVCVMQRIHERDLIGRMLERGGYDYLCLPTEFDPARRCETSIGFRDPRTEDGELLFPQLFNEAVIEEAKRDLGDYAFAAQHNQTAAPATGGIIKRNWIRFWWEGSEPEHYETMQEDGALFRHEQIRLDRNALHNHIQSWDMTFKGGQTAQEKARGKRVERDYVCGQAWAACGQRRFLLDQLIGQLSFTQTVDAVQSFSATHRRHTLKLVEEKANGAAVMDQLTATVGGFEPITPKESKEARAHAVSHDIRAGYVYLPHPKQHPWVEALIHEVCTFPRAKHDDQLDSLTQALKWYREADINQVYVIP